MIGKIATLIPFKIRGLHVNFLEISLAPEKISILYNTAVSKEDIWGSCWDPPHQNNKTDLGRPAQATSFRFFLLPFITSHLLLRFTFSSSVSSLSSSLRLSTLCSSLLPASVNEEIHEDQLSPEILQACNATFSGISARRKEVQICSLLSVPEKKRQGFSILCKGGSRMGLFGAS